MASVVSLTTIVIVVLASAYCDRGNFLYSKNLQKATPNRWQNDKEDLNRRMDTNARGNQVDVSLPAHWSHQEIPWQRLTREGRATALLTRRNKELQLVRKRLLEENLRPSRISKQTLISSQVKPKLNVRVVQNVRTKREVTEMESKPQIEMQDQNVRPKRDIIIIPQVMPEVIMQPHIQPPLQQDAKPQSLSLHFYNPSIYYPEVIDALANKTSPYQEKVTERRDKRQSFYMTGKFFYKNVRTTPNPFIRETNIADYNIGRAEPSDHFRQKPEFELDSSSYQLRETENVLSDIIRKLSSLRSWLKTENEGQLLQLSIHGKNSFREKRSPKMSKLHKKQKVEKKKRKKKKQKKLSRRQIKHYRRVREHKEERRKILHKRLKEKRRLRHKKLGTGPYNKTIEDYYGVYFDPPSSEFNDSMYNDIYDSSALDSNKLYDEQKKNYPENYPDSGKEEEEYEDDEEEEYDESEEENDDIEESSFSKDGGDKTKTQTVKTKSGILKQNSNDKG